MPHAVGPCGRSPIVDEHRVVHLVFLDELTDALTPLRQDHHDPRAARGVFGGMLLELAEPAAAVRSPGAAVEDEEKLVVPRL